MIQPELEPPRAAANGVCQSPAGIWDMGYRERDMGNGMVGEEQASLRRA